MILLPALLLSRFVRKLTSTRLVRPVVATIIDPKGLHWFLTERDGVIYVNTSPTAFTPGALMAAKELPLYALPEVQADDLREALTAYRERVAALEDVRRAFVVIEGGVEA